MTKNGYGKLAEAAYQTVLAKILAHELSGGSVIQERKLAEAMGISRTPMRDALGRLEGEGLVAFRYATKSGEITSEANPNGSARNIAGIYSPDLRVLGLMPHLENLVDPLMGGTDGKPLFDALAA